MPRTLGNSYGPREAAMEIVHTYPYRWNTPGIGSGVHIDSIQASPDRPVSLECSIQIVTAFNDSGDNLTGLGTQPTLGDILISDSGDVQPTNIGYWPANNNVAKLRLTAPTNLYIFYTQTDASAGHGVIIVKESTENNLPIN